MTNPLISIIVPVYNVEDYLRQCLDSIIAQTYTEWEAILVDDGSTDRSGEICDEYAKKDSRCKVYHLSNGGVSRARNYGIKQACTDWFTFMDSDDWIEPSLFEVLADKLSTNNVDCVKWGFHRDYTYGQKTVVLPKEVVTVEGAESYRISERRYDAYVWNTLYKRELIGNIQFDVSINWCEDHIFTTEYFVKCKSILWLDKALYHHRVGFCESLSTKVSSIMMLKVCERLTRERSLMVGNSSDGKKRVDFYQVTTLYKAVAKLYAEGNNRKERMLFCTKIKRIYDRTTVSIPFCFLICSIYNSSITFKVKDTALVFLFALQRGYSHIFRSVFIYKYRLINK